MSTVVEQLTGNPVFNAGALPVHAFDSFGINGFFVSQAFPGSVVAPYYQVRVVSHTLGVVYLVQFFNDRVRMMNETVAEFTDFLIDTTTAHQYRFFIVANFTVQLYVDGVFGQSMGKGFSTGEGDGSVFSPVGTVRPALTGVIQFLAATVPESDPVNPWTVAAGGLGLVTNTVTAGAFHLVTSGTTSFVRAYSRTGFLFDPAGAYLQVDFKNNDPTATSATFRSMILILRHSVLGKNFNVFFYADKIEDQASSSFYTIDTTVRHVYKLAPQPDSSCILYVDGVAVHTFPSTSFTNPYVSATDEVDVEVKGTADFTFYSWQYAVNIVGTIFTSITRQWVSYGADIPRPPDDTVPVVPFNPLTYYQNLLILQYNTKPRALAHILALIQLLTAVEVAQAVQDGLNLDTAVGIQLDMLGSYRGVQRALVGLDISRQYMAAPSYNDPSKDTYPGLARYGDMPTWFFLRYQDLARLTFEMSDNELRKLIRFCTAVQSSTLGLGELDAILWEFFGNMVTLTDGMDMTIHYTENPANPDTLFKIASQTKNLPSPAGVTVTFS